MDSHSESNMSAPGPKIKKKSWPSLVWLIPLVTILFGGWLIINTITNKGAKITIVFKTAEGIKTGKTKIKYKDIEIGIVDSVHFSNDFSNIIIKAEIDKEAKIFLRRDTKFWVVRPQLSLQGASGLGTIVSGTYIEITPGQGAPHKHFIGLDKAPVVKDGTAGTKIVLLADKLGSIDSGSPVYYHGIQSGEVLGYELGNDRKSIFIHAFIKAPFDEFIQGNTNLWNVSGMDVSVGADGINIRTESIRSLLLGGIAFDTPGISLEQTNDDIEGLVFTLHDSFKSIQEKSYTKKIIFLLYFDESVRGLQIGAPVELKGIKVGSVVDMHLEFKKLDSTFRIPVLIEIEPERIIKWQDQLEGEALLPYEIMQNLIDSGLKARLQTGSLLTGKLFVELNMHSEIPIKLADEIGPYPELPTIPASMQQMATSVKSILGNVEKLLEDPELTNSMHDLRGSLNAIKSILTKLDQSDNLGKTIGADRQTLEKFQTTLDLFNKMLMPDSPIQFNINQLTDELGESAKALRVLLELLERNPNSIIFGKKPSGEK